MEVTINMMTLPQFHWIHVSLFHASNQSDLSPIAWPWYRTWLSPNYEWFPWSTCKGCGMPARKRLPIWTPGCVSFMYLLIIQLLRPVFPILSCFFSTLDFEYLLVLSRFWFVLSDSILSCESCCIATVVKALSISKTWNADVFLHYTEFKFLPNCARSPWNICNGCGISTENAYSYGHLVLSNIEACMCTNVETNLLWTCLVSGLVIFWASLGSSIVHVGHILYMLDIPRFFYCTCTVVLYCWCHSGSSSVPFCILHVLLIWAISDFCFCFFFALVLGLTMNRILGFAMSIHDGLSLTTRAS